MRPLIGPHQADAPRAQHRHKTQNRGTYHGELIQGRPSGSQSEDSFGWTTFSAAPCYPPRHDSGRPHRRRRHRQEHRRKDVQAMRRDGDQCRPAGPTSRRSQVIRPGERSSNCLGRQSSTRTARSTDKPSEASSSAIRKNSDNSNASSIPASPASSKTRATRIAQNRSQAVVIYEVPLLFEAGVDKRVDEIIVVTADRETQIARLKKRNGLSRAEAIRRIRSQMPLSKKIRLADIVVDGTLPPRQAMQSIRRIYFDLLK